MVGTLSAPPPTPISAEMNPTIAAEIRWVVGEFRRCPISRSWNGSRILAAISSAITPKTIRSTSPEKNPASRPPTNVVTTTIGAQSFRISTSTAPRL